MHDDDQPRCGHRWTAPTRIELHTCWEPLGHHGDCRCWCRATTTRPAEETR